MPASVKTNVLVFGAPRGLQGLAPNIQGRLLSSYVKSHGKPIVYSVPIGPKIQGQVRKKNWVTYSVINPGGFNQWLQSQPTSAFASPSSAGVVKNSKLNPNAPAHKFGFSQPPPAKAKQGGGKAHGKGAGSDSRGKGESKGETVSEQAKAPAEDKSKGGSTTEAPLVS